MFKYMHVAQVKLLETTNARAKAEMLCQKAETDIAVLRRSQKRLLAETAGLREEDDLNKLLQTTKSSQGNWLP